MVGGGGGCGLEDCGISGSDELLILGFNSCDSISLCDIILTWKNTRKVLPFLRLFFQRLQHLHT